MSETGLIVKVKQGEVKGSKHCTPAGTVYYNFLGIPYAKPPLGSLRFKGPKPPSSWEGVRDGTKCRPPSPQIDLKKHTYKGDEDCLYINIYTPQLPGESKNPHKAVYVFLPWGLYTTGDTSKESLSPIFFMDQDVIFVSFTYRLGPLGFFSTGDEEASGNYGLKDQVMALKWIQQNIEQFGGNPNNVTLGGSSAGGVCLQLHLVSPLSKGLFHRMIIQSGSIFNTWALMQNPWERAIKYGKVLGCSTASSKDLVEYLRKIPAEKLIKGIEKSQCPVEKGRAFPYFRPCIETAVNNDEEGFLTEDAFELLLRGDYHKVPIVTGTTNMEGIYMLQEFRLMPERIKAMNNNLEEVVLEALYPIVYDDNPEKLQVLTRMVRRLYFGDKPLSQETLDKYVTMTTDLHVYCQYKFIKNHLKYNPHPLYCYTFAFDGRLAYFKPLFSLKHMSGVCHLDDMGYLFPMSRISTKFGAKTPEGKVRNHYIRLLTNFIKTGNPTPNDDSQLNIEWKPVTNEECMYSLNIDVDLTLCEDLIKEKIQIWEEVVRMALL